jgi:type I restriction enzyme, S subunit
MANGAAIIGVDYEELPSTWSVKELRQVGQIRYGLGQPPELDEAGVPMIRATNVKRGNISAEGLIRIKREAIPPNRKAFLSADDIIVVRSGAYTGDVARVTHEWEGSVAGYDLIVTPGNQLDSQFCSYCLLSQPIQMYFRSQRDRSAQPHLNRQQLETANIPIPPIKEQRAIAHVLDTVQQAKKTTEKVIAAARQLKQSLMRHLFVFGYVRFDQADRVISTETEIGIFPSHWSLKRIGEITEVVGSGLTPRGGSRTYLSEGIPLIRSQNVLMNRLDLSDVAFISEETNATMSRSSIQPGDVLLNITGASIGRTLCVPSFLKIGNVNQHVCRLRFTPECIPEFASYFFASESGQSQIWGSQHGATRQGLNFAQIRAMAMPVPAKDEQEAMARSLIAVEKKLGAEESRSKALNSLFQSLLRGLMTGQMRLPEFAAGSAK